KKIIIIGGGFAGFSAVKSLGNQKDLHVTLIDRKNHHLFQPLLYQVAMAGLNPSEISIPLRSYFSKYKNVNVLMAEVNQIDLENKKIHFDARWMSYDYLLIACGAKHFYFGNNEWEDYAPGLKTIEQATEIRRRILLAFELAEKESNEKKKQDYLTFVIVGGGPTGVEMAGSISEMARHTLYKDYKNANLKKTRVVLVEAGPRILNMFPEKLSDRAQRDLEKMGVEVILNQRAGDLNKNGLKIGQNFLHAQTIIWAAGIKPSKLTENINIKKSEDGRILVNNDLSIPNHPDIFVVGDQAAFSVSKNNFLPALAPVAIQQGRFVARLIKNEMKNKKRTSFKYFDKGITVAIGRSKAIVSAGPLQLSGFFAWLIWVFVHIFYLVRFKNKFFVLLQWVWAYFSFGKGARLIIHKTWKFYSGEKIPITDGSDKTDRP
ncbi:MAG: NAD(P)/FAD-dependent oxidoreductase, partial [Bdellovibrionales bacterium]|nr:NAD(P)/FAD-dependent oxidoreductase [Bdellovibrionales bacterium]